MGKFTEMESRFIRGWEERSMGNFGFIEFLFGVMETF